MDSIESKLNDINLRLERNESLPQDKDDSIDLKAQLANKKSELEALNKNQERFKKIRTQLEQRHNNLNTQITAYEQSRTRYNDILETYNRQREEIDRQRQELVSEQKHKLTREHESD